MSAVVSICVLLFFGVDSNDGLFIQKANDKATTSTPPTVDNTPPHSKGIHYLLRKELLIDLSNPWGEQSGTMILRTDCRGCSESRLEASANEILNCLLSS